MVLRRIFSIIIMACVCAAVFAGCSQKTAPATFSPALTCRDALSGELDRLSAHEVERLLDEALDRRQMTECWQPMVKQCLDKNMDIPQAHLARAVHEFNRHKTESYFHKSVFRYYSGIDQGKGTYRASEKALLTAYCRYVVGNAASASDPNVRNAELLARRLDSNLYENMFR